MLGLVVLCSGFTSAARAYVQGRELVQGSEAGDHRLQTYAASRNEKDDQAFLDSLSVPLGDRLAREQLEEPEPDYAASHAGFKQGKVFNADIPGMMLERNTVLLQKPFTVKKILEVIQQMNVSVRS